MSTIKDRLVLLVEPESYVGFHTLIALLEKGYHVRGLLSHDNDGLSREMNFYMYPKIQARNRQLRFMRLGGNVSWSEVLEDVTDIIIGEKRMGKPDFYNQKSTICQAMQRFFTAATNIQTVQRIVLLTFAVSLLEFTDLWRPPTEVSHPPRPVVHGEYYWKTSLDFTWSSATCRRLYFQNADIPERIARVTLFLPPVIGPDERSLLTADVLLEEYNGVLLSLLAQNRDNPDSFGAAIHIDDVAQLLLKFLEPIPTPASQNTSHIISCTPWSFQKANTKYNNRDSIHSAEWKLMKDGVSEIFKTLEIPLLPQVNESLYRLPWHIDSSAASDTFNMKFKSILHATDELVAQFIGSASKRVLVPEGTKLEPMENQETPTTPLGNPQLPTPSSGSIPTMSKNVGNETHLQEDDKVYLSTDAFAITEGDS